MYSRSQGSQGTPMKSEMEEAIADFYEANPLFYDKGNPDYKNKEKKRALLENFCTTLGMGTKPQDITRKFKSHRTEYVKLTRMKKSKVRSGKVSLTSLRQWKLKRYQFLDPYCKLPADLGWVPSTDADVEAGDEEEEEVEEAGDDEEVVGTSTGGATTPYGSSAIGSRRGEKRSRTGDPRANKKKGPTNASIADILTKFLQDSDKDKKRAQKEVKTIANVAQQPVDERVAWGQWLMSTCLRVPSAHFQQYQRDTFEATLRWIPMEPVVQGRPLTVPSALSPPQRNTPQQVFTAQPRQQQQQQQQIQQPDFIHQPEQQLGMGWIPTAPQATQAVVMTTMPDPTPGPSSAPTPATIERAFTESTPYEGGMDALDTVT